MYNEIVFNVELEDKFNDDDDPSLGQVFDL